MTYIGNPSGHADDPRPAAIGRHKVIAQITLVLLVVVPGPWGDLGQGSGGVLVDLLLHDGCLEVQKKKSNINIVPKMLNGHVLQYAGIFLLFKIALELGQRITLILKLLCLCLNEEVSLFFSGVKNSIEGSLISIASPI